MDMRVRGEVIVIVQVAIIVDIGVIRGENARSHDGRRSRRRGIRRQRRRGLTAADAAAGGGG